jgi:folate-binding protein YgfZ
MTDMIANAPSPVVLPNRGILRLAGPDRVSFLQGLISNDVTTVAASRPAYACLLTPQGKFLHDMFVVADGDSLLIDCEGDRRDDLLRRLKVYRLRSKVEIVDETGSFAVLALPDGADVDGVAAFGDPRTDALGARALVAPERAGAIDDSGGEAFVAYDRLRIAAAIPDGSRDMEVGKAILLENNIDLLNGIAWRKGCYIGQELTARTHYRGLIKKRLIPVRIDGRAPEAGTPLMENGVEIGEMRSSSGDLGLALLRLDVVRQGRPLHVEGATLLPEPPAWLAAAITEPAEA